MVNNDNQNNKKWTPYFKRENSIYQKHPFLAWSITIIVIIVGLWLVFNGNKKLRANARYNAGYRDGYTSSYQK